MRNLGQQIVAKWKSLCDQYIHCKNSIKGKNGESLVTVLKSNVSFNLHNLAPVVGPPGVTIG